jgi:hypothetical protein
MEYCGKVKDKSNKYVASVTISRNIEPKPTDTTVHDNRYTSCNSPSEARNNTKAVLSAQ